MIVQLEPDEELVDKYLEIISELIEMICGPLASYALAKRSNNGKQLTMLLDQAGVERFSTFWEFVLGITSKNAENFDSYFRSVCNILESELTFGSVCSPSDFLALKEAMLKTSQKPENTEPWTKQHRRYLMVLVFRR